MILPLSYNYPIIILPLSYHYPTLISNHYPTIILPVSYHYPTMILQLSPTIVSYNCPTIILPLSQPLSYHYPLPLSYNHLLPLSPTIILPLSYHYPTIISPFPPLSAPNPPTPISHGLPSAPWMLACGGNTGGGAFIGGASGIGTPGREAFAVKMSHTAEPEDIATNGVCGGRA